MNWVNEGVAEYNEWLKQRTFVKQDDTTGWSIISTPYVGIFNDTIDIFVKSMPEGKVILSEDGVSSVFRDDVKNLFHEKRVNVTPGFIASGRSGIRFTFDYLIAKPDTEIVLQTFNNLDRPKLATFLFGVDEVGPC